MHRVIDDSMSSSSARSDSSSPEDAEENYVCSLDERTLEKAIKELNEDPKNRLASVETLRQWIQEQPHIRCPTDAQFLLPFLRARYFVQLQTRRLLETFLTRRTKFSKWFINLDTCDPQIQAVINDGAVLVLPERDDEGRKILIIRLGNLDFTGGRGYSKQDILRTYACLMDFLYMLDENTSVNGTVTIVDMGNYTIKQYMSVTKEERADFLQTWQSGYPARIKTIHVYNIGALADVILTLIKFCMTEKIQKRVKTHGSDLESLYKEIPMKLLPAEYLPSTYEGRNAGTERQIIDNLKSDITKPEVRSRLLYISSDQFGIDASKKTEDVDEDEDRVNPFLSSFRKLNFD